MVKDKEDKVTKKETSVSTKKKIKSPKKEAVVVAKSSVAPTTLKLRGTSKAKEDKPSIRTSHKTNVKKVGMSKTASAKGYSVSKTASAKGSSVLKKVSPVIKLPVREEVPEVLDDDFDEIENDTADAESYGVSKDNDVRLTPKIRISKIGKLFHKDVEQKNVVSESLPSVQVKRMSYVDEDEDIVDEDLELLPAEEESKSKPSFKEIAEASIASVSESPSELPDLLPADEEFDELEDTADAKGSGVSKTASAESYGVSKNDEAGNIAMLDEEEDDEDILGPRSDKNKIILKRLKTEKHHPKIYKYLAITFSVLAFFLLIGVLYFTLVKVTISVSLNEQAATETTNIQVYDRPVDFTMPTKAVRGLVKVVGIEQSKLYQVSGNDIIGEEVIGQITLFNKYNKSQPLVASTRLLSTSGKLYRLKNSVTVPAGGQVVADIYADEAKPESAVGAEQFTLPGLWEGLQDKIYGQSTIGAIKYQQKLRRIITQADIDNALVDLKQVLLDKVKADFDNAYDNFDYKLYKLDEATLTFTVSGKVGEEKEQLPVSMKGAVDVVAFDTAQALEIAKTESTAKLPTGQDLLEVDGQSVKYNLTKFDPSMVMAEVGLDYNIKTRANGQAGIIDKNKIIGLSEDQLKQYLNNIKDVKVYNIEFFPSFLRHVPRLTDRIEIKMMD